MNDCYMCISKLMVSLFKQHEAVHKLYLHVTVQPFIQFTNLLPQQLQIIGLVQDVRIQLEHTNKHKQYKCHSTIRLTFSCCCLLQHFRTQAAVPVHKTPPD